MNNNALQEINEQLLLLEQKRQEKKIIDKKLKNIENELSQKVSEINRFKDVLAKEKRDVDKLENFTLTNFISTIIGSKNEKLDKEKREYLDAKMKMDKLKSEEEMLHDDLSDIKRKTYEYKYAEHDIEKVKEHKVKILQDINPAFKEEYQEMMRQINLSKEQMMEIDQAVNAGNRALTELSNASRALTKAKNLGTWDIILDDSFFTSIAKHNQIDSANSAISRAQSKLRAFNNELKDVKLSTSVKQVSITGVNKTFDIWFDNIFSDFNTQNKIKDSIYSIQQSTSNVRGLLIKLDTMKQQHLKEISKVKTTLDNILVHSMIE